MGIRGERGEITEHMPFLFCRNETEKFLYIDNYLEQELPWNKQLKGWVEH